jgi:hypothetical protein
MRRNVVTRWRVGGGAVLVLALLAAAGCGAKHGRVSGTVTYKGAPLGSGSVAFFGEGGTADSAAIGPDGKYTLARAPVGPVKVSVVSGQPRQGPKQSGGKAPATKKEAPQPPSGETPPQPGKYVPIPAHFADPEKSGLTYTVSRGEQTIDIKLE